MTVTGIGSVDDDQFMTLSSLERVIEICDRFEATWRDGLKPMIEDYVDGAAEPFRASVLRELLLVELELRTQFGEAVVLEDYLSRFPVDGSLIRLVFDSVRVEPGTIQVSLPPTQLIRNIRSVDRAYHSELTEGDHTKAGHEEPSITDDRGKAIHRDQTSNVGQEQDQEFFSDDVLKKPLGRFILLRLLGQGIFGAVYLARDNMLDREVAIKLPHTSVAGSLSTAVTSLTEAKSAARLRHPAIVTIHDVVQLEDGTVFVVMEYIEGSTLGDELKVGPIAPERIAILIAQVAEALYYAHTKGFVHRDIKPANILIDRQGQPHVADFGLAVHEATQPGRSGEMAGTVPYMAPEQVRGEAHRLDGRTDVWALGVILYELLTRRRPFGGNGADREQVFEEIVYREVTPPRKLGVTIPRELERICLKCLSKRMADRYPSAGDLAEDLRNWLTARGSTEESSTRKRGVARLAKVVPKGLRSFSPEDAPFFLELMPGPRDREGLPEVVRFWKTRIEAFDQETAFALGLIFGPSGCGKSSLVHAGILPRLNESILVVSVIAGASSHVTEIELLRRLRHYCSSLTEDIELPEALRRLRQGQGLPVGKKLLIVLDQFEQYLQSCPALEVAPMVEALRQCDGEHVQCLVLVRDDFWMALTRFLRMLEINLSSERNMVAVDLFDREHARAVLAAFGRGHGKLPESPDALTSEQRKFLDEAVNGLAEDDRVICVRLALFAEMFKDRPWTSSGLKELGGMQGVGVAFLEATIGSEARHPMLRLHGAAARAILESLLPPAGSPLKGQIRSYAELLITSGYNERRGDFRELLRVLDSELRLLTPAEEPATGLPSKGTTSAPAPLSSVENIQLTPEDTVEFDAPRTYYQLTHDYLVPSIRDWLDRKRRETRRGRALVRLSGLTALWTYRPEPRNLPSFLEWLTICWHTRPKEWAPASRIMMSAASRRLGARLVAVLAVMIGLGLIGFWAFDLQRQEAARLSEVARLEGLLTQLDTIRADRIPSLLAELRPQRKVLGDKLHDQEQRVARQSETRLAISLVFLPEDPRQISFLVERLQEADPEELKVISDELKLYQKHLAAEKCWQVIETPAVDHTSRLRLAGALAVLDPDNPSWRVQAHDVAAAFVKENQPLSWTKLLRPVRMVLTSPLREIYTDKQASLDERVIAGIVLTDFFRTDGDVRANDLTDLVLDADSGQFRFVFPSLLALSGEYREAVTKRLSDELQMQPVPKWDDVVLGGPFEGDPTVVERLKSAQGMCREQFALCQTLPLDEFSSLADALRESGYRPSCVRPYLTAGKILVAGIWTRDGLDWQCELDLTASEVRKKNETFRREWELHGQGFLPVDIASYIPPDDQAVLRGRDPREDHYAALWVKAEHKSDGSLGALEFIDAKMYVGVEDSNHPDTFNDLTDTQFIPRTNLEIMGRDGVTRHSSVRWKLQDPPRFNDTWHAATWEAVEEAVKRAADLALMPIDLRFSRKGPLEDTACASTWWSGVNFESRVLHDLSLKDHLMASETMVADGFRPMGIAVAEVSAQLDGAAAPSRPQIVTASVWRRPLVAEGEKDRLAQRQANAVIALFQLGFPGQLWRNLVQGDDPRLRSELIERLSAFEVDPHLLAAHLNESPPPDASVRRGLLLALANMPVEKIAPSLRDEMKTTLDQLYRNDPDRGIHSAVELILRNWRLDDVRKTAFDQLRRDAKLIQRLDREGLAALAGKQWFVTPSGYTMAVLPGPLEFTMGSPGNEPLRDHNQEPLRKCRIDRTIAVATEEVTLKKFLRFFPEHAQVTRFGLDPECPANNLTWYEAIEYCNKLSSSEGLELCYPTRIHRNMVLDPNLLLRNGYRLLTEAESECCSRAGTRSTWYFGHSESLVSRYAWTVFNSEKRLHPVGRLLPNDFGLFDTVGNVFEWCHDRHFPNRPGVCDEPRVSPPTAPPSPVINRPGIFGIGPPPLINPVPNVRDGDTVEDEQNRVMRGGSFFYIPLQSRSAYRDKNRVNSRQVYLGFRVARTLPTPPESQ
jgi:serine/threonine protein kinase/formylglycine-generating enzyme required for sulfatase activity